MNSWSDQDIRKRMNDWAIGVAQRIEKGQATPDDVELFALWNDLLESEETVQTKVYRWMRNLHEWEEVRGDGRRRKKLANLGPVAAFEIVSRIVYLVNREVQPL